MVQRRSFYDDPSAEVTWPLFAALPRPPPIPPRRRPVPEYNPASFYFDDKTAELQITIPPKSATGLSPRFPGPSPASLLSNPFTDPHVSSIASDVPLLHRTLLLTDDSGDSASIHSHAPSTAPSTPSIYPPSLLFLEEHGRFSFTQSRSKISSIPPARIER